MAKALVAVVHETIGEINLLKHYHIEICQRALGNFFSPRALRKIISANVAQDGLLGQIGHPEFHFDDNAIDLGYAYIEKQRQIISQITL